MAKLVSLNVGLPKEVAWRGQRVYTAIWKQAVDGKRMVRRLNVDGDGQGDLAGHGGEHRAVFVYQTSAYDFWSRELRRSDFTMGQFGENFTVEGLSDDEVRIGDRYRIGQAVFEVTQPRVTCYRVGIRMDDPQMPAKLVSEGRPGFYLRVLEEGTVASGDPIELVYRNAESVTVADADALLYRPGADREKLSRLLRIPALSPGWQSSLQAILDQPPGAVGNAGLSPTDLSAAAQTGFQPARIAELSRVTADVVSVGLEAADGGKLSIAKPGQFVVVKAGAAASSAPIVRSYSLSSTRDAQRYELGVKCEKLGMMGHYFSEQARVGDAIEVSAPRGSFVLRASEKAAIFVSAGIGITPVLAMLEALADAGSSRNGWWLYGARNGADNAFAERVRRLLSSLKNMKSHVRFSRPAGSDRIGFDFDSVGHVDADLVAQLGIDLDSEYYLCGPASFMREMKSGLSALGVPSEQIFSEVFGSGPKLSPGIVSGVETIAPHEPAGEPRIGPMVSFARSGLNVRWDPRFGSLLDFAEACDVPTRWSCRTGVCHTCESGLISGEVAYDPMPIQAPESGNLLICCAQPKGEVVLDL